MTAISTNYRPLSPSEVDHVAEACAEAWQSEEIPQRQFELAVKDELENYRAGGKCAPFDTLVRCLKALPKTFEIAVAGERPFPRLLDVGASGGYYSEVLQIKGYNFDYTGVDFSPSFKALAETLYPGIRFDVGDARDLPYKSSSFAIVLSGCCLLHIPEYEKAIAETARVASHYAIFSKTPILLEGPTKFYEKTGYGLPMLEIHFAESDILWLFAKYGLTRIHHEDVSTDGSNLVYRTYLCRKIGRMEREWERA